MPTTTTATHGPHALLSLADIARLASVQRPVASMWVTRFADGPTPFPGHVAKQGQVKFYDPEQIASWLQATGLGNNPDAYREALAYVSPVGGNTAEQRVAASLLVLAALSGEDLEVCDPDDLAYLAEEIDPTDSFLRSEIIGAAPEQLARLASHVAARLDCSYGPADALYSLEMDSAHFGRPLRTRDLTPGAREFVLHLAEGIANQLNPGSVPLVAPIQDADLLTDEETLARDGGVLLLADEPENSSDTDARRAAVRRLHAAEIAKAITRTTTTQLTDAANPAVILALFPPDGFDAADGQALIEQIEDVTGELTRNQFAVVLGPAGALADAAPVGSHLEYPLSRGYLRAAVRLGGGVWQANPNAHAALWLIGCVRPPSEYLNRTLTTADVAGRPIQSVSADLITDLLAALADAASPTRRKTDSTGETRTHVHQLATTELLVDVMSEDRRSLVMRDVDPNAGVRPLTPREERTLGDLRDRVASELPGLVSDAITSLASTSTQSETTTETVAVLLNRTPQGDGELGGGKRLRLVPGLRLAPDLADAANREEFPTGPAVIGPEELLGQRRLGHRRVDMFMLEATHPNHQLTERGDVVFTTAPEPAAWVDLEGSNVVVYPARALRITEYGRAKNATHHLTPQVLAADLRRMPGKDWRATRARLLPAALAARLDEELSAAQRARAYALERADQLADLMGLLGDAIAGGSLVYPDEPPPQPVADDATAAQATTKRPTTDPASGRKGTATPAPTTEGF